MAKRLTITQRKRLLNEILAKSKKLWASYGDDMSTADVVAIEKIVKKNLKRYR